MVGLALLYNCQGGPASFSLMQSNYRGSGKLSLMMQRLLSKIVLHVSLILPVLASCQLRFVGETAAANKYSLCLWISWDKMWEHTLGSALCSLLQNTAGRSLLSLSANHSCSTALDFSNNNVLRWLRLLLFLLSSTFVCLVFLSRLIMFVPSLRKQWWDNVEADACRLSCHGDALDH